MSDFLNNGIWFISGIIFGSLCILYFNKFKGNYHLIKYFGSPGNGHTYAEKNFDKIKK